MATSEWSLPLGNMLGSRWRISWVLLTVCLIILTLSFWRSPSPADADLSVLGPLVVLVFSLSLVVREMIDWMLSKSIGVEKEDVCIGPLGNMVSRRPSLLPRRDLFLAASGPLTHLLLGLFGLLITVSYGMDPQWSWLNPVTPPPLQGRWEWSQIGIATWTINWSLALLKLLPAQPLDGYLLLLSLLRLARPNLPSLWAGLIVRHISLLLGAMAFGFSLGAFLWAANPGLIPDWIIPASIAVFLVWGALHGISNMEFSQEDSRQHSPRSVSVGFPPTSARRNSESRSDSSFAPFSAPHEEESSDDDDPAEDWAPDPWLDTADAPSEPAFSDFQKMDAILAKIHAHGAESLDPEERELLAKASEYLRNKRGDKNTT